jgi:hypothetical protein
VRGGPPPRPKHGCKNARPKAAKNRRCRGRSPLGRRARFPGGRARAQSRSSRLAIALDTSTVSRRLRALEETLGARLFRSLGQR